jgi:hypothetical protein
MALKMAVPPKASLIKGLAQVGIRSLGDPHLLLALGITTTFFLSPLVWFHYYTLALLPAFWLLSPRHPWRQAKKAAWISIILTSSIISGLMRQWLGFTYIIAHAIMVLGLLPLWAGVLAAIAAQKISLESEVTRPVSAKEESHS